MKTEKANIELSPEHEATADNTQRAAEGREQEAAEAEPVIIVGGASEVVFTAENDKEEGGVNGEETEADGGAEDNVSAAAASKGAAKSLRIIEGGGKEIVIDDSRKECEKAPTGSSCTRNNKKDKRIGDIGTYTAIGFLVITIGISLFNIKGMRYPLSCLFLSLAGLTMGITTLLRYFNNKKCGCTTCAAQSKTFTYSAALWLVVFLGALIAFIVLTVKNLG